MKCHEKTIVQFYFLKSKTKKTKYIKLQLSLKRYAEVVKPLNTMYRMALEAVRQLQNTSQDGKQSAAQKEHFILRESFLLVTNIT